jgi:uncharacterized Fe-S cluster-containing radical SAM superfamily protein
MQQIHNLVSSAPSVSSSCDANVANVARFEGTLQAMDCAGTIVMGGRARLKRTYRAAIARWPAMHLPLVPASVATGHDREECRTSLLIQLAGCNLRCWFCFVDDCVLAGNAGRVAPISTSDVVAFLREKRRTIHVVMVSGGEPLLQPSFLLKLKADMDLHLGIDVPYMWIETNLTVDPQEWSVGTRRKMGNLLRSPRVGVTGCVKSYHPWGYYINTRRPGSEMWQQIGNARRLQEMGADLYPTIVLAGPTPRRCERVIDTCVKRLRDELGQEALRRIIPLEIRPYRPTMERMSRMRALYLRAQYRVLDTWLTAVAKELA